MKTIKKTIWILCAALVFVWLVGVCLSITALPIYLTYKMVITTGFHLWEFIKILGGSLICYFGFFAIALRQYMFLMSHNWITN